MFMSFEIFEWNFNVYICARDKSHGTQCTNINGTACMCKTRNSALVVLHSSGYCTDWEAHRVCAVHMLGTLSR